MHTGIEDEQHILSCHSFGILDHKKISTISTYTKYVSFIYHPYLGTMYIYIPQHAN